MGRIRNHRYTAYSLIAVVLFVAAWQVASSGMDAKLFPPPSQVAQTFWTLLSNGTLASAIWASLQRVLLGWIVGSAIAIPLGILAGTSRLARAIIDPFIHFFRFVPALALVSLFILWFGVGEASKVNLVAYAAAFIVMVTTASGAAAIPADKLNAARCLGASRLRLMLRVVVPATIPSIFTGMRLALANAFLVIVAAEALATQSGIGYMIWNARNFFRTDQIFVGILCFGILGFVGDRLWKWLGTTLMGRYLRASGGY